MENKVTEIGGFKVIECDEVEPGVVYAVIGLGFYNPAILPRHVVSRDEDGVALGFNDAVKVIDCGRNR